MCDSILIKEPRAMVYCRPRNLNADIRWRDLICDTHRDDICRTGRCVEIHFGQRFVLIMDTHLDLLQMAEVSLARRVLNHHGSPIWSEDATPPRRGEA